MSETILLVMHQASSNPGRVGAMLAAKGYRLEACRVPLGDRLSESLEDYAGAVIYGGPMSANDDDSLACIAEELAWLEVPLRENKPFLGLCLGGHLLARFLGAEVTAHEAGMHEIGYYPVRVTAAGRGWYPDEQWFYHWHAEGFGVPVSAELLATGRFFPNQAFRYGRAHAIRFHPEITGEMMLRWSRGPVHRMVMPGAKPTESHVRDHALHDAGITRGLDRFLDDWLESPLAQAAE